MNYISADSVKESTFHGGRVALSICCCKGDKSFVRPQINGQTSADKGPRGSRCDASEQEWAAGLADRLMRSALNGRSLARDVLLKRPCAQNGCSPYVS